MSHSSHIEPGALLGQSIVEVPVQRVNGGVSRGEADLIAVEEPLEIRLGYEDAAGRTVRPISVTMRTPGHDVELAIGFLFTEGIIHDFGDVEGIRHTGPTGGKKNNRNVVTVTLKPGVAFDAGRLERHFYTTSSCGVCGKTSLDALAMVLAWGKSGRLFRALTDQGLTAQVTASTTQWRDPGLFYFLALLAPGRTHDEVEAALGEVIARIQEEGITETELQRAKNQLRAQEAYSRDGPYAIAAQLNEAIAAGDWKLYTTFRERLERLTTDDVQRVAQTYLLEDACTVGWYVPSL